MKLNKIIFQNINSLKGIHEIDFDTKELSNAGLILISGPTGAGKSTILDVITLALYGNIPRLGAISNTTVGEKGSVMTHDTREAFAEIHYTIKQKKYSSKWSIRLTKGGNVESANMQLSSVTDGLIISTMTREVIAKNTELIGLNIDHFLKSILLSQGEFAKFLHSKSDVQLELLESIVGTDIYRKISQLAYQKKNESEAIINNKIVESNAIPSLTEEELESIQISINTSKTKLEELAKNVDETTKELDLCKSLKELLSKKSEVVLEIEKLKLDEKLFSEDAKKLQVYESLIPFFDEINLFLISENRIKELKNELSFNQSEILKIDNRKTFLFAEIKSKISIDDIDQLVPHLQSVKSSLEILKTQGNDLIERGKLSRNKIKDARAEFTKLTLPAFEGPDADKNTLSAIEQKLKEINLSLENDHQEVVNFTKVSADLEIINRDLLDLDAFERLITDLNKYEQELLQLKTNLESSSKEKNDCETALSTLAEKLISEREKINELQKVQDKLIATRSLEQHRTHLVDEQPCPLCGSTDHPYADPANLVNIGESTVLLAEANKSKSDIEQKIITLNSKISQSTSFLQHTNTRISVILKDQERIEKDLGKYERFIAQNIESLKLNYNRNKNDLQTKLNNLNEKSILDRFYDLYKETNEIIDKYRQLEKQRSDIFGDKNGIEQIDKWVNEINQIEKQLISLTTSLNNNQKNLVLEQTSIKENYNNTILGVTQLGYTSMAEASAFKLNNDVYEHLKAKSKEFENENSILTERISNIENQISKFQEFQLDVNKIEKLQFDLGELKKNREFILTEIGKNENQIEQHHKNKTLKEAIHLEVELLKKQDYKWQKLNTMIGSSDGKKYAVYAQELTMKYIIKIANKRLLQFSDRYQLEWQNKELNVFDSFFFNKQRSVKTLSGGETFMVSLAMALSLSDLASKDVKLECLFIDEGFGSLDEETLSSVISTLEKLQMDSSKTIGLISHVEFLKDRIGTKIVLNKGLNGLSSLSIIN
jgi:DNA repair protein SbcC/Rad50